MSLSLSTFSQQLEIIRQRSIEEVFHDDMPPEEALANMRSFCHGMKFLHGCALEAALALGRLAAMAERNGYYGFGSMGALEEELEQSHGTIANYRSIWQQVGNVPLHRLEGVKMGNLYDSCRLMRLHGSMPMERKLELVELAKLPGKKYLEEKVARKFAPQTVSWDENERMVEQTPSRESGVIVLTGSADDVAELQGWIDNREMQAKYGIGIQMILGLAREASTEFVEDTTVDSAPFHPEYEVAQ